MATDGLLAVLSVPAPAQAPRDAWVHAVIVVVLQVAAGAVARILGRALRSGVSTTLESPSRTTTW